MAVQTSYPGVYIDEFAPGAPIQGVGTSVAAFVGAAARGPLREPVRVLSWDQFRAAFGEQPVAGFYLWYAVRGFFQNGGQDCYVVRVSNGDYATATLTNRAGTNAFTATARTPGLLAGAQQIEVRVFAENVLDAADTRVFRPTAAIGAVNAADPQELTMPAAAGEQFRPGDPVTFGTTNPIARVVRITRDGANAVLQLDAPIGIAAGNVLRGADLTPGTRTFRLERTAPMPTFQNAAGVTVSALAPGTVLTVAPGTATAESVVVESVQTEHLPDGSTTWRVTLRQGLAGSFSTTAAIPLRSEEVRVRVTRGSQVNYTELGVDPAHPRYVLTIVNGDANGLVRLDGVQPPPPDTLPASIAAAQTVNVGGGADEDLTTLASGDFTTALDGLARVEDVNLLAAPDAVRLAAAQATVTQQAMITQCEQLADRFAVLDARPGLGLSGDPSVVTQRQGLDSTRGYGGVYYPWLEVPSANPGPAVLVPPSGHVCGVIARVDLSRGVHKAPANEIVRGTQGVERRMSDVEQGLLNLRGINVVRQFTEGGRPILWGARTTATDTNWIHVSTRRLFLFLEESIEIGIRWAVFEPNNLSLWQKLRRTIRDFLMTQYRAGALFGETPDDAFYVRIDEDLNPFSEQQLGRLHLEIGVRPAYPAEFIIVRIGIWDGGSEVTEG